MKKFTYEITIEASTEKEADSKMFSLTTLAKRLTEQELEKLSDIVRNDPVKTALAKKALGM